MGVVIAILVIALLGATWYVGYDIGYGEGHRSGYYNGEQAGITACQQEYQQIMAEQERMWRERCNYLEAEYQKTISEYEGEMTEAELVIIHQEHENAELRNIINQIETEMARMENENPSSDFGGIEDLLNLIWMFV